MSEINGIDVGKCGSCPEIKHCLLRLKEMDDITQNITNLALDSSLDEMLNEMQGSLTESGFFKQMQEITGRQAPDASEMLTSFRQQTAAHLNHIDDHKAETIDEISTLTAHCEGPLKMRAAKAGKVITATICASQSQPDGFSCEIAHVDRKTN